MGNRGSYTLEAALVMSAVILALSALILAFVFVYHQALLTSTACSMAEQAVSLQTQEGLYQNIIDINKGMQTFSYSSKEDGEFPDFLSRQSSQGKTASPQQKKLQITGAAIYEELSRRIKEPEETKIEVAYTNRLLQTTVAIDLQQKMKIPFGGIKALFSGSDNVVLTGRSRGVVVDPAEYIRNIDLVQEYAWRITDPIEQEILKESSKKLSQSFSEFIKSYAEKASGETGNP